MRGIGGGGVAIVKDEHSWEGNEKRSGSKGEEDGEE
jgi:hypothetical protein